MTPHGEPRSSLRHNRFARQYAVRDAGEPCRKANKARKDLKGPAQRKVDKAAEIPTTAAYPNRREDEHKRPVTAKMNANAQPHSGLGTALKVTSIIRPSPKVSAMLVGRIAREEDSPSGLWRTLGKRVGCKPSGVRIPHPPPYSS